MRERKVGDLIVDFNLYPRTSVDQVHLKYMAEAEKGGATFPPIVICQKSRRIVDGVHRHKMYGQRYGPEHVIEVIEKRYRTEGDIFIDAMRLNAGHGRTLTRFDRVHCMLRAEDLKITAEATAAALSMPLATYQELRVHRVATTLDDPPEQVPLKNTIKHMAGQKLTADQTKVNEHLSGMNQLFYVNQLVMLIQNDLIDLSNEDLMEGLKKLGILLRRYKLAA